MNAVPTVTAPIRARIGGVEGGLSYTELTHIKRNQYLAQVVLRDSLDQVVLFDDPSGIPEGYALKVGDKWAVCTAQVYYAPRHNADGVLTSIAATVRSRYTTFYVTVLPNASTSVAGTFTTSMSPRVVAKQLTNFPKEKLVTVASSDISAAAALAAALYNTAEAINHKALGLTYTPYVASKGPADDGEDVISSPVAATATEGPEELEELEALVMA